MSSSRHIIWNEQAGSAVQHANILQELTKREGVTVHIPQSAEDARRLAADASNAGADIVVAAGGDGTVNDVLHGLVDAGLKSALGVLPLGTGNDFCRNAEIPLEVPMAVHLLENTEPRAIDIVQVESDDQTAHYLNMATGGNTGLYTDLITDEMKKFWGPLVYLRGTADILTNLQTYRVTIGFDDQAPETFKALNVFIANGRCSGGGLPVAPDAELDDGLLDIIVVLDCSPIDLARLAAGYVLSDYRENENVVFRRAKNVSIRSNPPLSLSADGDVLTDAPVQFRILPGALQAVTGLV